MLRKLLHLISGKEEEAPPYKTSIYRIGEVQKGTLYIMPRPSPTHLEDDICCFKAVGVDVIFSFLEKEEEARLGLELEEALAERHGIQFYSFPIIDRTTPDVQYADDFIEMATQHLVEGRNVAVHCRVGIGRSGLAASCILIRDGMQSDYAMSLISHSRGMTIPDTPEQVDFIYDYEARLKKAQYPIQTVKQKRSRRNKRKRKKGRRH